MLRVVFHLLDEPLSDDDVVLSLTGSRRDSGLKKKTDACAFNGEECSAELCKLSL